VTQVDANWIEPIANCGTTPNGTSSAWVGVDGASNSALFQTGTETDCVAGSQQDSGWVEELPDAAQTVPLTISPGDEMSADVRQTSQGYWNFTLLDDTTGNHVSFINPIAYSGPENSAEWIEEDPSSIGGSLLPYNDFGTVNFSGLEVNSAAPNLTAEANGIEMVQGGRVVALPSAFASGSDGFSVTYQ
jgi:hypothetical protein